MLIFFVLIHLFYFWGIEGLTQTGASSSAGTAVGAEVSDAATAVDLLCAVQAEVPPPPQATFCKKKMRGAGRGAARRKSFGQRRFGAPAPPAVQAF